MPVANCIITPQCQNNAGNTNNLVELWSSASNISSEHMTINIVVSNDQIGKTYAITATLLLPSIWSNSDISSLQIGLAKALALHFNVLPNDVFVATSVVNSGMVVESGEEIKW